MNYSIKYSGIAFKRLKHARQISVMLKRRDQFEKFSGFKGMKSARVRGVTK